MLRTVALLTPPFASLTYAVPEWLAGFAWCPGLRVAVPLGRGMLRIGVVLGDGSPLPEGVTARPMLWPLEKEPLLPSGHMEMVRQLALRQAVTPGQILAMVLPAGLRVTQMRLRTMEAQGKAQIRLLKDLPKLPVVVLAALGEAWMRGGAELLGPREDAAASELCVLRCDPPWAVRPTATRQIELLEFLLEHGAVSRREVLRQMGQGVAPALESLLKNGLIGLQCLEAGCAEEETGCNLLPPASEALFALSEAQEAALASFRADLDAGNPASHLLFGVTGSGKTAAGPGSGARFEAAPGRLSRAAGCAALFFSWIPVGRPARKNVPRVGETPRTVPCRRDAFRPVSAFAVPWGRSAGRGA